MVTVGYLIWFFESIIDDIERDTEDDDQIQLKWINEIRQELRSIETKKNVQKLISKASEKFFVASLGVFLRYKLEWLV